MEKEFDLQISNHDFNAAKEQLKQFAEQDVKELKFDKVRTHEDIFGIEWAEHGVTGKELNSLIEKLQKYFSNVYDRDQNLIKEFGEVYKALEALDKDYIQAILTSVSAIKKTNEKILIEQERIDKSIDKQTATLVALKQFKEKVSAQLSEIDSSKLVTLIEQLESRVEEIEKSSSIMKDESSEISQLKNELDSVKSQVNILSNKLLTSFVLTGIATGFAVVTLIILLMR
ncbi:hypothetical protein [Streptococcus australis]|uniref:hypothetical protein n=1 Tax=Streptococcus australis TaxID=113107 RepID=UPI00232CDA1F|nr:hypothetical protein [Streptococcus australis]MDB8642193.1 hypothetical protein [Streptococcus australis]MDB8646117.1 hypothetical protein [Streptococcus australis]